MAAKDWAYVNQQAWAQIAKIAAAAARGELLEEDAPGESEPFLGCTPVAIPDEFQDRAVEMAAAINPINLAGNAQATTGSRDFVLPPLAIAVITSRYWGPQPRRLTVSFMETTPTDLRKRILEHMNAWTKTSCIEFVYTTGLPPFSVPGVMRVRVG